MQFPRPISSPVESAASPKSSVLSPSVAPLKQLITSVTALFSSSTPPLSAVVPPKAETEPDAELEEAAQLGLDSDDLEEETQEPPFTSKERVRGESGDDSDPVRLQAALEALELWPAGQEIIVIKCLSYQ